MQTRTTVTLGSTGLAEGPLNVALVLLKPPLGLCIISFSSRSEAGDHHTLFSCILSVLFVFYVWPYLFPTAVPKSSKEKNNSRTHHLS